MCACRMRAPHLVGNLSGALFCAFRAINKQVMVQNLLCPNYRPRVRITLPPIQLTRRDGGCCPHYFPAPDRALCC